MLEFSHSQMTSQLSTFYEAIAADPQLQQKLNEAADADAVVTIAKASGFDVTVDELLASVEEASDSELSAVSGGIDAAGAIGLGVGGGVFGATVSTAIAVGIK